MFPWLIWLCMAGTAKARFLLPFPPVIISVLRELHTFIGTMGPSDCLQRFCVPPFVASTYHGSHVSMDVVGSPQLARIALCSMDRSQTPPQLLQARPFSPASVLSSPLPTGSTCGSSQFRCSILFLLSPLPRFTYAVTVVCAGSVLDAGLLLVQAGVPPACYLALRWAHGKSEIKS